MSRTRLDERLGPVAQLVERLNGIEEVSGSRPLRSTNFSPIALAKVAELAYASVSKTDGLYGLYGFKSHLWHHFS